MNETIIYALSVHSRLKVEFPRIDSCMVLGRFTYQIFANITKRNKKDNYTSPDAKIQKKAVHHRSILNRIKEQKSVSPTNQRINTYLWKGRF